MRYIVSTALTSSMLLLSFPAFAEDAEDTDAIVVTANGFEQPAEEVGQAITVIDGEALARLQITSITDVLATVPGVRVSKAGAVGQQASVFIRGGNSSQTLVLIDGVRINDASTPNGQFDFGALLTGNIDRVEVLRGPNSVIWGSQAIGGVINVTNALPSEDGLAVRARGEYGYAHTASASGNVAGRAGGVSGSVGGSYFRTDGISAIVGGTERDGYRNASANARLKVELSDAVNIDLRGYYNDADGAYDDSGPNTPPAFRNKQFLGYAGLNASLMNGKFNNRLSYSRTDIDRDGTHPNASSFSNFAAKALIDRFEYQGRLDVIEAATLVVGLEHERTGAETFFPAGGGTAPDKAKSTVTSGYAQAIIRPVAGLTLTGGLRHDDFTNYGSATTFGANFVYTPNEGKTLFRGTYAEGFRAPTLVEAIFPFGNPALKPEKARSFDVGVEHKALDGRVVIGATWFQRKSDNLIEFSLVSFQSENIARARSSGLELMLAAKPTDTLTLSAQYSFTNAENRSPGSNFGKQLARRAKHSASLSVDWATPWKLDLGASLFMQGDSFNNPSNSQRLDGFALVGLRAAYPITETVSVYARVENLFDVTYATVASFSGANYGSYGRNAYAGVKVNF
jgi:vitamin B12 transporter